MDRIFQFFKTDESYRKEVSRYGVIDGVIAVLLYGVLMAAYYWMGSYQARTHIYLGDPVSLLLVALCVGIALLRKDGIKSLGFSRRHAMASIITGLVLGIVTALCNAAVGIAQGAGHFASVGTLLVRFCYYLFIIALSEEVIFRGYIQSRIFGLLHNNALATAATAVMFMLSHIPYHLSVSKMSLLAFCRSNAAWFVSVFILHLIFTYLYRKYNSIFASTIFHALMDWSNELFVP